ncbi:MAG: hypothetical protein DRO40_07810 [Thermoprotei archaeon]|nr:MAG: hypothetical protein DRO40_07810 [Thermoprotei archaeon]
MVSKIFGVLLIIIAVLIIVLYIYGLIIDPDRVVYGIKLSELLVKYTILVIMFVIACIIGYIGYLIVTTPKPKSIEEFIKEYEESET